MTRLCKAQDEVLKTVNHLKTINVRVEWSCDETEKTATNREFSEDKGVTKVFGISMVHMQMYSQNEKGYKCILWQNPPSCSARYCRPIKFVFSKKQLLT